MSKRILYLFFLMVLLASPTISLAEEGGGAAEMARKLQDPLASKKAIMTDNTIGFNTGVSEGTSYGFQLQTIYAFDFPDKGFTLLTGLVMAAF